MTEPVNQEVANEAQLAQPATEVIGTVQDDQQQETEREEQRVEGDDLEGFGSPGDAPKQETAPIFVCGCPCGHQLQVTKTIADYTLGACESIRCGECYPWNKKFKLALHKDCRSLEIKSQPNMTPQEAEEISKTYRIP